MECAFTSRSLKSVRSMINVYKQNQIHVFFFFFAEWWYETRDERYKTYLLTIKMCLCENSKRSLAGIKIQTG